MYHRSTPPLCLVPHRHKSVASSNRACKACIKVEAGLEHSPPLGRARKATSGFCVHYRVQRSFSKLRDQKLWCCSFPPSGGLITGQICLGVRGFSPFEEVPPLLSRHLSFSSFHFDAFCTLAPRGLCVWSCCLGLGYYLEGLRGVAGLSGSGRVIALDTCWAPRH